MELNNIEPLPSLPVPWVVEYSPTYGNYIVASRDIAEDELILCDRPLLVSPYYDPEGCLQICLACHKEVTDSEKCVNCQWPLCDNDNCAKNPCHTQNECDIFAEHGITCSGRMNEYLSVETLRCLLLRKRNPTKWARIWGFEGHSQERIEKEKTKKILDFVVDFISEKCAFHEEFDVETLNHVVGVLSINTFCGLQTFGRYSSILFDKLTFFNHDCDANTTRKLMRLDEGNSSDDCCVQSGIAIEVRASRPISKGESITVRYIYEENVTKRRAELRDLFYFDCTCCRCQQELLQEAELALGQLSIENKSEEIITKTNVIAAEE